MSLYINEIKRKLIDEYKFPEDANNPGCVLGNVPDGKYPMIINGRLDHVRITDNKISCCNFDD